MSEPEYVRVAEHCTVTRVVVLRGEGKEPSPYREVECYYRPDGTFIGEDDPVGREGAF